MDFRDAVGVDARGAVSDVVGRDQTNIYHGAIHMHLMYVILKLSQQLIGAGLRELLEKYVVPDAAYNRRGARDRCLEGTREPVISKIMDWARGDTDHPICWFYGPAGFGKHRPLLKDALRPAH
jgi:hypothetical protein